nr:hypothetical protein [Desulfobacula sp.]
MEVRNDSEKDKKIAKRLKILCKLVMFNSRKKVLAGVSSKILLLLGLIGVSSSQIVNWLDIPMNWIQNGLLMGGVLLISLDFFKGYLTKLADFFDKKAEYYTKSISEVKKEIKKGAYR